MFQKFLSVAAALAFVTLPHTAFARVHHAYGGALTPTYSLTVNSDCTLSQSPGGNFAFTPISALQNQNNWGPGSDWTSENIATTQCKASSAVFTVSDPSNTGNPNYYLSFGAQTIGMNISSNGPPSGGGNYTNSNSTGITLNTSGTVQQWPMYGGFCCTPTLPPGTYSDTITLNIIFS